MNRIITIGRSSQCDIVIAHEGISRVHAEISLIGNQYVYKDISKNGSSIGGRMINNERVSVAAGTEILLANRIPLPWAQIYSLLPMQPSRPYEQKTIAYGNGIQEPYVSSNSTPYISNNYVSTKSDEMGAIWGVLAFIIPLLGWILYFAWKNDRPNAAAQVAKWAWIGFGVNLVFNLIVMAA